MRQFLQIQAYVCGCWLGGLAGATLVLATVGRWALEDYQAKHPGTDACGMFPLPYVVLGVVPGAVAGGFVVRGLRWFRRCALAPAARSRA
jgi:hypothetical protein